MEQKDPEHSPVDGTAGAVEAGSGPGEPGDGGVQGPSRLRDAALGLLILLVSFVGSMLFSLWARDEAIAPPAPAPGPATTALPGFPGAVDPFEVLPYARELTVRRLFQGFVATGVGEDGTLDFSKQANLRFSFQSPPGRGPQPQRAGGTLPARTFCGRQMVVVDEKGMRAKEDKPSISCSLSDPRELPGFVGCGLDDIWSLARKHKFRRGHDARIEYYRSKAGPAFRFVGRDKKGKTGSLVVSARDCRTLISGKDQRGSVP